MNSGNLLTQLCLVVLVIAAILAALHDGNWQWHHVHQGLAVTGRMLLRLLPGFIMALLIAGQGRWTQPAGPPLFLTLLLTFGLMNWPIQTIRFIWLGWPIGLSSLLGLVL